MRQRRAGLHLPCHTLRRTPAEAPCSPEQDWNRILGPHYKLYGASPPRAGARQGWVSVRMRREMCCVRLFVCSKLATPRLIGDMSSNSSSAGAMDGPGKPAPKQQQSRLCDGSPSCSSSSQAPPAAVPAKGRRGAAVASATGSTAQAATADAAAGSQSGCGWQAAVVLVLDEGLQQLPWESCAGLRGVNMYR